MDWFDKFPQLSASSLLYLKKKIDNLFFSFGASHGEAIENFFEPLLYFLIFVEKLFVQTPWVLILFVTILISYFVSKSFKLTIAIVLGLCCIGLIGLWEDTMKTLSIILVATFICIVVGVPIGTIIHNRNFLQKIVNPVLDMMQTIPTFVYLIPIITLMGIGKVPGLIAVCVYSVPPVIRLTSLGLRQVPHRYIETAMALGLTRLRILLMIKFPLALQSILVGINQTIMMSLGMVVIASMIGVSGLGSNILKAINNQYITTGLLNGFAIVVIAIILDRLFQSIIKRK
tara:strand:+ start:976 stop:1836 length:861 start_codon:yes stop_codon:yes gene_type:complete